MKDFFKYMLATACGILLFMVVMGILGIMSLVGVIASGEATKNVSENTVLVMKLDGEMNERSETTVLSEIMNTGNNSSTIGLDNVLSAIKKAKNNDNIKGIYIEVGAFSSDSYASTQAFRNALLDFKKSGKWIVTYADVYSQSSYYLASVADQILLNPQGEVDWHGIASEPMFLKDLMAKFGVKMQLAKVGKYKSAPEMFTADQMSEPNREQVTVYVNGLWQNVCKGVSESRKISVDSLNAYADRVVTFEDQKNLLKYKLVDKLVYQDEIKGEIKKRLGLKDDDNINTISLADMGAVKDAPSKGDEIAIYYAYGDIVDSNSGSGLASSGHQIVGPDVCKDIENLMNDDDVKAVVLRINSGGGSAFASEQMWHSIKNLKAKKPVVVSMGGMAASGGYYMSCIANWIVAEPTTLTGSIGIFGMFPDFSGLLTDKLGVKFDEVKTNKNSSFGTRARPFNAEEMSYLNAYIDRGYDLFLSRVAEGRKMTKEQVNEIAQGRVWLGQDALKIKLVDELGGLEVAVAKAAKLAKMDEYHTYSYPAPADFMDQLMSKGSDTGSFIDEHLRATLGEYYEPFMLMKNIDKHNAIQARIPFYLNIR